MLTDNIITTMPSSGGFTEKRTMNVVAEELYYTESFASFTVLIVDSPLIGKIDSKYLYKLQLQHLSDVAVQERTLDDSILVLEKILSYKYLQVILSNLTKFASEVTSRYVMVKTFELSTSDKLNSACSAQLKDCIAVNMGYSHVKQVNNNTWSTRCWAEAQVAIQTVTVCFLHQYLLAQLHTLYASEDSTVYNNIMKARSLLITSRRGSSYANTLPLNTNSMASPEEPRTTYDPNSAFFSAIGLRPELRVDISAAVLVLNEVGSDPCALRMIARMQTVQQKLVACVANARNAQTSKSGASADTVAAEDIIPLFMYAFVTSEVVNHLYSLLVYIKHFRPSVDNNTSDNSSSYTEAVSPQVALMSASVRTGMGYLDNTLGLPADPVSVLGLNKLENISSVLESVSGLLLSPSFAVNQPNIHTPTSTSDERSPVTLQRAPSHNRAGSMNTYHHNDVALYAGYNTHMTGHSGPTDTDADSTRMSGGHLHTTQHNQARARVANAQYDTFPRTLQSSSLSHSHTHTHKSPDLDSRFRGLSVNTQAQQVNNSVYSHNTTVSPDNGRQPKYSVSGRHTMTSTNTHVDKPQHTRPTSDEKLGDFLSSLLNDD